MAEYNISSIRKNPSDKGAVPEIGSQLDLSLTYEDKDPKALHSGNV